jgi:pyruvate kinase
MIRTKIVATLGPATSNVDTLVSLFEAGADVCRLNFSHGDLNAALKLLNTIQAASAKYGQPIAVLGDLGGPKIRLGKVPDVDGTGGIPIHPGDSLIVQREPCEGRRDGANKVVVNCTYPQLVDDVKVGDRVLVEDGMLRFVCVEKSADSLCCNCTTGGVLKSAKGINLPTTAIALPSITEKDWECIDWAIEHHLDYLALSFVRKADDLNQLRDYLRDKVSDIHLVAKIEKAEALQQIDAIIEASDGLMVARGDLGVEMDAAQVPLIQKDLIRRCRVAGKPVIVATQMLQSMIEQATPTRAEVSDVANAIFDGTDAVMLSGETSVGKYPVGTVLVMAHVAEVTENYIATNEDELPPQPRIKTTLAAGSLAGGVRRIVRDLGAKLVVVWTQTGGTARVFSKHHFPVPIVALSNDQRALRRMALHYGVTPQHMPMVNDIQQVVTQTDALLVERQLVQAGDRVVIVAGWSPATPGTMNGMVIHTIGTSWTAVPSQQVMRQMLKAEKE